MTQQPVDRNPPQDDPNPLHPWTLPKDPGEGISSGQVETFDEWLAATEAQDDSTENLVHHAQRLLNEWDLPPRLRRELQSFVDHPHAWR